MSKLHKKCFVASAGMHLLLFLVLMVGPAFLMSRDKMDELPTLDFIPSKLIDEQFYRVSSPMPQRQKTPTPQPPAPQRQPEPKQAVKVPEPKPEPAKPAPKPEPKYSKPEEIKISLKPRKSSSKPRVQPQVSQPRPDYSAVANTIRSATSSTTIVMPSMPSGGGPSYANYAQAVKSIYEKNWSPPDETSRDDALVKVQIVIAKDGTILSSRIIGRSGEPGVDASVEATLRRVTKVPAFPEGAKESKRTYTIGFNLRAKRGIG